MTDNKINKAIEKYEGKTIRINKTVYTININKTSYDVVVYLSPKFGGSRADEAYSSVRYDDYRFTNGGETYRDAVKKAKEILEEIEEVEITDFQ